MHKPFVYFQVCKTGNSRCLDFKCRLGGQVQVSDGGLGLGITFGNLSLNKARDPLALAFQQGGRRPAHF